MPPPAPQLHAFKPEDIAEACARQFVLQGGVQTLGRGGDATQALLKQVVLAELRKAFPGC